MTPTKESDNTLQARPGINPKITIGLLCFNFVEVRISAQQLLTDFFLLKLIQSRILMFILFVFYQTMLTMMPTLTVIL